MIQETLDFSSEPMITPKKIYKTAASTSCDVCLITFSKIIFSHVLQSYDCTEIAQMSICNGNIPIYRMNFAGKRIAFYLSAIGSAMAGTCIEEAAYLIGAEHFIMFGSAGCLNQTAAGKIVLPTYAYRDEGFSYHYCAPADYIEIHNASRVAGALERRHISYEMGRTWTTDAIYRETAAKVRKRKAEGCVTVEMECAGAQAVCDYLGVQFYDFLTCGDILDLPEWDVGGLSAANHKLGNFSIALAIASEIMGK